MEYPTNTKCFKDRNVLNLSNIINQIENYYITHFIDANTQINLTHKENKYVSEEYTAG